MPIPLRLLAVLLLLAANAFFVAAEFALVRARRARIDEWLESGDRLARSVLRAQSDIERTISGTQLGITLASLGLGWIGEPAVAVSLERGLAALGLTVPPAALHAVAIAIAFGLLVYLHIVLGELAPKAVALASPESVSRRVAAPLNLFNRLMAPVIWSLNRSADLVVRLLGLRAGARERVHSPEEIELLVQESLEEGVVAEDEQAMIHGVFELTRTMAREVMTPRPDIVAIEAEATLPEVLETAAASGFSRLPVYRESIDDILGVLLVKDLLRWVAADGEETTRAQKLVREAIFVPDTKPVDDLLTELRYQKVHMAIVVDEFGGTDGIVTLEDVLEEIVGEIYDEHDVARPEVWIRSDGRIVVEGGYGFSDLLDRFDLPTVEEDYDTVAGFVIGALGRIPERGERVPLGTAELEVLEVDERRITRLELRPEPEAGRGDRSARRAP